MSACNCTDATPCREHAEAARKERMLAAAAPELLEALKEFQIADEYWETQRYGCEHDGYSVIWRLGAFRKAREVIAKAEGRK